MTKEPATYVADLCRIYSLHGSFDASETRNIGSDIYCHRGHAGMMDACYAVRNELGGSAARDLEFHWDGISEWLG
jgi:hypothetical protein